MLYAKKHIRLQLTCTKNKIPFRYNQEPERNFFVQNKLHKITVQNSGRNLVLNTAFFGIIIINGMDKQFIRKLQA